ncbi:MAG: oxidoreductase [Firmicutes bacterium HGW-Firmicutes-20]|jgi:2,4-dienoyl-CoA reductase-like NADH-dependent reductase (Old Yellow Enzyme family)|nr:MAG: oxidoreductase [Firmicutes bacterium HGW-Firmicutes-20]PKM88119.1 MAG: oxidoreductase [Firmicutes bacterium HGW-Firmicutes-10]
MQRAFQSAKIGNIPLKNRFFRSATHDYFANPDGSFSERQVDITEELAKHRVGAIITAITAIRADGISIENQNRLDDDMYIESLQKLCDATHRHGSKVFVQLAHGGAKSLLEADSMIYSPSTIQLYEDMATTEMSVKDIALIIEDFVNAAWRAKLAKADGVQLHAAHGYLLSQFISFVSNTRTDEYGGSASNRFRIVKEIIERIVKEVDFPVILKLNSNLLRGNHFIEKENETYLADLIEMIKEAKSAGCIAVELSGTGFQQLSHITHPYFIHQAIEVKKLVDIPVILVGGIRNTKHIQQVMDANIDFVSMSRPFICEPDLVDKFKAGQFKARCILCNQCFVLPTTKDRRCVFHK